MTTLGNCPECGSPLSDQSPLGLCPRCILRLGMGGSQWATVDDLHDSTGMPPKSCAFAGLFPELEILEPIGKGGMAVVYKARQIKLDRLVALKLIRPEVAEHPAFFDRFSREARAMARLNHSNIVRIYDFGETGGLYHLMMELVEGNDLRRRIGHGPMEPKSALVIALQICDALHYAHERGVIHRDIKPENLLIDWSHGVKIADFGLAKLLLPASDVRMTVTRQIMGTPLYMAPEQLERPKEVDHRADIYALGVVLYEMLAGVVPYGRYEPLSETVDAGDELDEIVGKALARKPSDRYDSVSAIRHDLAEFAEEHFELPDIAQVIEETLGREARREGRHEESRGDWSWLESFGEWIFG
jgi:serine/threonine protein kinase